MSKELAAGAPLHVQLYGRYRDIVPSSDLIIELPCGSTVADLVRLLHEKIPGDLPARPVVAVNRRLAEDELILEASDEVALIPAVAGG